MKLIKYTGFSSEIGTKLRDWAIGQARGQLLLGGEIKRDPEMGKTAIQPEPAQTADLSISGSCLISSVCTLRQHCPQMTQRR